MIETHNNESTLQQQRIARMIHPFGAGGDPSRLGGKGSSLDRLVRESFPVPEGFVLLPEALDLVLQENGRTRESIGPFDETLTIPDRLLDPVMNTIAALRTDRVAVRSSAVGEDGDRHSFAGQYESTLGVPASDPQAVARALRRTWGSLFSDHAISYRETIARQSGPPAMAVVVQSMVDADFSGVLFTVDPLGRREGVMILNLVRGLGDRLVSGEVTPEEIALRRSGEIGPIDESVLLGPSRLERLRDLARRIESSSGGPQDIEFAVVGEEIMVLQARPVTVQGVRIPQRDRLDGVEPVPVEVIPPESGYWELASKDFTRPVTPVTVDLYFPSISSAIARFFEEFGILLDGMEMRVIGGHPYSRMIPPGGKDGAPPPPFLMKLLFHLVPSLRTKHRAARSATENRLDRHYVERWQREWRPALEEWLRRFQQNDLRDLEDRELVDCLGEARQQMTMAIDAHFLVLPAHFLANLDLYSFIDRHLGWTKEQIGRLISGASTETAAGPHALGRLARRAGQLLGRRPEKREDVELLLDDDEEFARAFDAYVDRFCLILRSFDLDTPVEAEDRSIVCDGIIATAAAGYDPDRVVADIAQRRTEAIEKARQELSAREGGLIEEFDTILSALETGLPIRDDTGLMFLRTFGALRLILIDVGRRLVERDVIDDPEDFAYLTIEELLQGLDERRDRRELVRRRMGQRKWAVLNPGPPSWGEDPGPPPPLEILPKGMQRLMKGLFWQIDNDLAPAIPEDEEGGINGIGAAAGVVTGTVRVLREMSEATDLKRGEILVCPVTTPAWGSLFPLVDGIITDAGGVLSHPAIIAREFGIPAVVGTGTATSRLKTGDLVRLDGATGRVDILS